MIMDNGIGRDPPEHFRIKHLQMSGFQFPQCQFLLAKIRDDGAFQQSLIGTVGCVGQPSLGDLQPFQQIVGEQHITAQVARLFGRFKLRPEPCQFRLGLALISLFGKSQRDPFRFSLPSGVFVVQHGIILAVFQSQMSCYHFVFLLSFYLQNRTPNRQHQYTIGLGFSLFCKLFYRSRIGTNQRASRFRSLCRFSSSRPLMMSRRICSSV